MNDIIKYETYLFISLKKIIISVNTSLDKKIHEKDLIFEQELNEFSLEKLDFFLNENIFKIEKKLKNFIKKTTIILDLDVFFPVEISVKKNNYDDIMNSLILNNLLYEAKECCKKTIIEKKIIHMIINNYQVDNKDYSFFPKDINCNNLSLDVKFFCISNNFIKDLEKILKKYQISLNQVVNADYIKFFLSKDEKDIFSMAKKIIDGHNPNEVLLVKKTNKNQGFFEKFFNFFK